MIIGITDSSLFESKEAFRERVLELIDSDLNFLIFREKDMDAESLVAFLLDCMVQSDNTCRKIVVHSQVEAARHLGLTYVHLPEKRVEEKRKSHTRYSYSVHNEESLAKVEPGALFTLVSPAFETTCKPGAEPLDEETLVRLKEVAKVPLVALGGITPENASKLKNLGYDHIALRSSLMTAENPHDLIAIYREMGF